MSYLTALIVSLPLGLTGMGFELVVLLGCVLMAWRWPRSRSWSLAIGATVLFAGSMLFIALSLWMWYPPSSVDCDTPLASEAVERLSPAAWVQGLSQPYSLLYIPEEAWLLASFKMAGNGHLDFWDEPTANRVMGVDIHDTSTVVEVPFVGQNMPCYMVYEPRTREVFLSQTGVGADTLDILSLADLPRITHKTSVDVAFKTHSVVAHPSLPRFGVLDQQGWFFLLDGTGLEEVSRLFLGPGREKFVVPLGAWHAPGTSSVYLSVLLGPVVEVDMDIGYVRWSEDSFGGGTLTGSTRTSELFQTDLFLDRVNVIDRQTLTVTRRLELDYTPRAVAVDESRDLLIVGDWFGGVARFYRMSTLEPLPGHVPVGPYLRDLAYAPTEGLLFTGSKCGVYQVDVAKALGR
jgi:hypothetical protein